MARKTVPEDFKIFSERLSALMKEKKMKQQDLADVLEVKRQTVSLYMIGKSMPDAHLLRKIAVFFKVSADWLLGLTDTRTRNADTKSKGEMNMNERETRILADLLAHLQADRTDLMRRMDEVDEQAAVVADLLHQAIDAHKAEDEEDEDAQRGLVKRVIEEEMGDWTKEIDPVGIFKDMMQQTNFFLKSVPTNKEDDDDDED